MSGVRATAGRALEGTARLGYAVKGLVYGLVGVITVQGIVAGRRETPGTKEAMASLLDEPFGRVMVGLIALGLAAYAIWRFAQAGLDPGGDSADDGKALRVVKRIGFAISGVTYGALAFYAASRALGFGGGGDDGGRRQLTARLMSIPAGRWLVGVIGVVVIGVGVQHFVRVWKASFMKHYDGEMSARQRTWARRIGRFGLAARGVAFGIIGALFIVAAWRYDPDEAKGLGGALATLAQQPYGPWLLGVVACGLVAYALYCGSRARWRRMET